MSGKAPGNRDDILPASLPPRGLTREQAAAYLGIGRTLFDEMVADGRMPKPKTLNSAVRWDRKKLDDAWDDLPELGEKTPKNDPWSGVAA
jgi:excisionase family DNA binding protein